MKRVFFIVIALIGPYAFSCDCVESYKTPYAEDIAKDEVLEKLGLHAVSTKVISYSPTLSDRLSYLLAKEGKSCIGKVAGSPIHYCTERFIGSIELKIEDQNCEVTVRVKRMKYTKKVKIIKNTCN